MARLMLIALSLFLLSARTVNDWTDPKYQAARTAGAEQYLSAEEKEVYFLVNLARMFPSEFAEHYVKDQSKKSSYHASLYKTLKSMKALPALKPDKDMYDLALCWAKEGGKAGAIGHMRKKCKEGYRAECCSYGENTPTGIVMQLLVDQGIPSLGHRKALLSAEYAWMGVSIAPHKRFTTHAVLDMK